MKITINLKKGTNPDIVTVSPQAPPEVAIELEGEAEELKPFFNALSELCIK